MHGNFLTETPSAGTGRHHFRSEFEMIEAYVNQSHASGRHRQSRMSWEGVQFISYWTTIARWVSRGSKKAVVLDVNSFGSTYTPQHRKELERSLRHRNVRVFHVDVGRRNQDMREFDDVKNIRDHHVCAWKERIPRDQRYVRDDWGGKWVNRKLRPWTLAERYLDRVRRLPQALEVCEFFGLPDTQIRRMLDDEQSKIVAMCELLFAHYSSGKASWYKENYQKAPMEARLHKERERLAWLLQDAEQRAKQGPRGWFGRGDWMIRSMPEVLTHRRALRAMGRVEGLRQKLKAEIELRKMAEEQIESLVVHKGELEVLKAKIQPVVPNVGGRVIELN